MTYGPRPGYRPAVTVERDSRIAERYRMGRPVMEIATELGVSRSTVHHALVRHGEPRRPRIQFAEARSWPEPGHHRRIDKT